MKRASRGVLRSPILGSMLFCVALFVASAAQVGWAQAPQEIETIMNNMLAATQAKSLEGFVAAGDATFRSHMTQPMLDSFNAQVGPRLNGGYTTTFLGRLSQGGYAWYLWKLEFKDGGDDRLVQMVVKDGKVSGFFLH